MTLQPGEYYPRIWRGQYEIDQKAFNSFGISFRIVIDLLDELFRTVEPSDINKKCYGQKIRHLFILVCTEIEASWRGILVANNYPPPRNDRYSTNDYVKLNSVMKLNDWAVILKDYEDYGRLTPFKGWTIDPPGPSKTISWYNDYNKTKHDREGKLKSATLANVITAIAGLYVMGMAQFGRNKFRFELNSPYGQKIFQLVKSPTWLDADQYKTPQDSKWTPVSYSF